MERQTDLFADGAATRPDVAREDRTAAALREEVAALEPIEALPADLPDRVARIRIQSDLETSLLVEAGAGAGKTTEMVNRMIALVRTGRAKPEAIAAVTFTRKAAAELREKFQTALETQLRRARHDEDDEAIARFDDALRDIDRAFIGTIHSFCARLLRDRALDVGLDPGFHEAFAIEQTRLRREFFTTHIERLAAQGDAGLAELAAVGLRPQQLRDLFDALTEHADVEFPAPHAPRPDPAAARAALERLLDEAVAAMPAREPEDGWDNLQRVIRRLQFHRSVVGWTDDVRFLHALAESLAAVPRATFRRWGAGPGARDMAKLIQERFRDYAGPEGEGGRVLREWWAHRYPFALWFALRAARAFEAERLRTGALSFQDLLLNAARLLRESRGARNELGERFRYLLVDEFQDTDPIQAEVLLLLASEPEDREGTPPDWRKAVPRPGALFVVGDPKQSIYRFRRADMTIYAQVKRRFGEFGGIVELVANFRSGPPIEALVNRAFQNRFPADATEHQAAFAPLRVRRGLEPRDTVGWYTVPVGGRKPKREEIAAHDAQQVASWIARRINAREREAGDFLVLTRGKKDLLVYAREIEARNLPVQVTGARVSLEHELSELRLILATLADPGDATLTLAALVGLFFGLDWEQLAEHVLDRRGRIDFMHPPDTVQTDVEQALVTLHELWNLARNGPADLVVAEIIDRFGLLPFAAAGELGESRAGALLYVLETVRSAALQGDASLRGALDALDAALGADEAEAPLQPGRRNVVRVMNLHQAKGLESPVVILAEPAGEWRPAPHLRVTRPEQGPALGWIVIAERRWTWRDTVLARPLDWEQHGAIERDFDEAEQDRLLYVAATRAKQELIVAHHEEAKKSPWGPLYPYLEVGFPRFDLDTDAVPERARLQRAAADITAEAERIATHRSALAEPSYRADAVTRRARAITDALYGARAPIAGDLDSTAAAIDRADPGDIGSTVLSMDAEEAALEWGRRIHGALEAAARGADAAALRAHCRVLLGDSVPPAEAEATIDRLTAAVAAVTRSETWTRAQRAHTRLVETPFAIAMPNQVYGELTGLPNDGVARLEVIEGVIDLAFREDTGWTMVDWKSDVEGRDVERARLAKYRAQVDLYASCWTRITGEPVVRRILFFTTDGTTESW
ncbi:MAG: UvrD-helicase domain-containing protein [Gemmatimonadetes bacterium]|nr:UvrD-helicase domain-containing protein [Gemmatimonadota bacterium]